MSVQWPPSPSPPRVPPRRAPASTSDHCVGRRWEHGDRLRQHSQPVPDLYQPRQLSQRHRPPVPRKRDLPFGIVGDLHQRGGHGTDHALRRRDDDAAGDVCLHHRHLGQLHGQPGRGVRLRAGDPLTQRRHGVQRDRDGNGRIWEHSDELRRYGWPGQVHHLHRSLQIAEQHRTGLPSEGRLHVGLLGDLHEWHRNGGDDALRRPDDDPNGNDHPGADSHGHFSVVHRDHGSPRHADRRQPRNADRWATIQCHDYRR